MNTPAVNILTKSVGRGEITGGSVIVRRRGEIVEFAHAGWADASHRRPLGDESLFRLASMTKPIVAAAVAQLLDEGMMTLDAPAAIWLPELASTTVLELGLPPEMVFADRNDPDVRRIIEEAHARATAAPAHRPITIRDLLTHSSGLGQGPGSAEAVDEASARHTDLAQRVRDFSAIPGDFHPGEGTGYSPLVGFDILGRIIEVVTGKRLGDHLRERLFEPAGMNDTAFLLDSAERSRLVELPELRDGRLVDVTETDERVHAVDASYGADSGGAGLIGSLRDYDRFARMLIASGEIDGHRVMSERAVRMLTAERSEAGTLLFPGVRWGLGVLVHEDATEERNRGSWGWSGAWGTHFYVDPEADVTTVVMINRADIGGASSPISAAIERAVTAASVRRSTVEPSP